MFIFQNVDFLFRLGTCCPKAFWPTSDGWLLRLGRKNATFLCHHFPTESCFELTKPNQTDAQIWSPSAQPDLSARTGLGTVSCPLVWLKTLELCLSPSNLIFGSSRMGSFDISAEKSWTLFSWLRAKIFPLQQLPGRVGSHPFPPPQAKSALAARLRKFGDTFRLPAVGWLLRVGRKNATIFG